MNCWARIARRWVTWLRRLVEFRSIPRITCLESSSKSRNKRSWIKKWKMQVYAVNSASSKIASLGIIWWMSSKELMIRAQRALSPSAAAPKTSFKAQMHHQKAFRTFQAPRYSEVTLSKTSYQKIPKNWWIQKKINIKKY